MVINRVEPITKVEIVMVDEYRILYPIKNKKSKKPKPKPGY